MNDDEFEMKAEYDFSNGIRGPIVPPEPGKTRITIRIDDEVIEWFRRLVHAAGGGSYQTEINRALHSYITAVERPNHGDDQSTIRAWLAQQLSGLPSHGRPTHRSTGVLPGWQQYAGHANMDATQIPGSQP